MKDIVVASGYSPRRLESLLILPQGSGDGETKRKGEEARKNEKRMCGVHRSVRDNICVKRFELFCEKRPYINLHTIFIIIIITQWLVSRRFHSLISVLRWDAASILSLY